MNFIADQQTLADLNLVGKYRADSVFSLFNRVKTGGGERLLQRLFENPLSDPKEINKQSRLFCYFQQKAVKFPFTKVVFDKAELYLSIRTEQSYPVSLAALAIIKMQSAFLRDVRYQEVCEGLAAAAVLLDQCRTFLRELKESFDQPGPYDDECRLLTEMLADNRLLSLSKEINNPLSFLKVARYNHLLRYTLYHQMETLLMGIYKLDVYIAVSRVAKERGFSYPVALPGDTYRLDTSALWHPALIKGVSNPLYFNVDKNMLFLTGANMAGKSTIMKALGIAVYLAHMGFPVAAKNMQFSVMDGIYSSINVPDDLSRGYSHFFAEVLRVKKVAEDVAAGKNLLVLFDELFKGTNVKDAYDATSAVTKAFSEYRNCFFVVSTHIIEVAGALSTSTDNLQFSYLPTIMKDNVPRYTYRLNEGISADRQGMIIIENEGILNLLQ